MATKKVIKKKGKIDIPKESQKIFADMKACKIDEKGFDDAFDKLEVRIAAEKK